jgi:hypothetical protein
MEFLQTEYALSSGEIEIALRSTRQNNGPLPIVLWQYGLVTIQQLDGIYDWLETKGFYDFE